MVIMGPSLRIARWLLVAGLVATQVGCGTLLGIEDGYLDDGGAVLADASVDARPLDARIDSPSDRTSGNDVADVSRDAKDASVVGDELGEPPDASLAEEAGAIGVDAAKQGDATTDAVADAEMRSLAME